MNAKDVADAILREFRTNMADLAAYAFDSEESAQDALDVMDQPDWLTVERQDNLLVLMVSDSSGQPLQNRKGAERSAQRIRL